jgi:hypothetical protein
MYSILYPLIPALYAWQVHGLWIGVSVYVILWLLYVILAHVIIITKFGKLDDYTNSDIGLEAATLRTFRWLRLMRWSVLVLSMVAIGLSTAQTCDANFVCQPLWSPHSTLSKPVPDFFADAPEEGKWK